jgi:hypothetical protein
MRKDEELLAWAFNDAQPFGRVGRLRFRVSQLTTAVLHPEGRMELAKHADMKSLTKFVKLHKPRLRLEPLPNEPASWSGAVWHVQCIERQARSATEASR